MNSKNLVFLAGKKAYPLIKQKGLSPDDVKAVYGAAGGPKWLTLNWFDRMFFTQWLNGRKKPLYLLGSSIGAWRFSTMCQSDPLSAQEKFQNAYIHQQYSHKPTAKEITVESRKIMECFLGNNAIGQILNHPYCRINFLAVRSKWPSSSDRKPLLGLSLFGAVLLNLISRKTLGIQFERTLFQHPGSELPFLSSGEFPINRVDLSLDNFTSALLASGSIPMVMEGVSDIKGAPAGIYRDGGVVDYHLDIPLDSKGEDIVLYPHFSQRLIPGWLDKPLKWRKPKPQTTENMLLVAPSDTYLSKLPNGKIPDRNDFFLYQGRDSERFRDWTTVVEKGKMLADEFFECVESGTIKERIKLMP